MVARKRYKMRYMRLQHRPASSQVNAHDRVFGTHTMSGLLCEPRHQLAELDTGWRSSEASATWWMRPVPCDSSAVPSQQHLGCHDPALAEAAGERGGDRAEQRPVCVVDGWPLHLAAKDLDLVA